MVRSKLMSLRSSVLALLILPALLLSACGTAQPKTYKIGVVLYVSIFTPTYEGFKTGMTDLGYVEGKNVTYIYNGVVDPPTPEAIDAEIKSLLAQDVDMLFTAGNLATLRAKEAVAGTDIPVVFSSVSNPQGEGLVESISHPAGSLTGVQVGLEIPKALEMLVTLTDAKKVYLPYNPRDEVSGMLKPMLDEPASRLGIELVSGEVTSVAEAVTAIENLPEDIDAIYRLPSPTLDPENSKLSQAAIKRGLPMGSGLPLDDDVLITLASDFVQSGKASARMADQIFKGTKPADLPVETADSSLTINLKTAKAIGLEISDDTLRQASKVIR